MPRTTLMQKAEICSLINLFDSFTLCKAIDLNLYDGLRVPASWLPLATEGVVRVQATLSAHNSRFL